MTLLTSAFAPAARADLITIPYVFVDGQTLPAAKLNANNSEIYNEFNGNITNANINALAAIAPSKLDLTQEVGIVLRATNNSAFSAGVTGDTVARAVINTRGSVDFGAGGASARDVSLIREAAGVLAARNLANSAYEDLKCDNLTVATAFIKTGAAQGALPYYGASGTMTELAPSAGGFPSVDSAGTAYAIKRPYFSPTGHRLSLTSGVPVTTSDVTAAGTIYSVPFYSRNVWLKVGSGWVLHDVAQTSLALTLTSGSVYDVFMYSNAGTPTLETLVWTNTTTRATAIAVDADTGFWIKSGDATRLYVGTIYATASNQTEDSTYRRMVFNAYNRVPRRLYNYDNTNSWTYASATYRAARNQTGTPTSGGINKIDFIIGGYLADTYLPARFKYFVDPGGGRAVCGIAMDSTTTPSTRSIQYAIAGLIGSPIAQFSYAPALGYHYITGLEANLDAATNTAYGDDALAYPSTMLEGDIVN